MGAVFDVESWAAVPFGFWAAVFFVGGAMVGSFLNVCIYRMPLGQSVVRPGSHCPGCNQAIPWHLNIPLVSWPMLRGKCARCGTRISPRYVLVELLTACLFLGCWIVAGRQSVWLALAYCLLMSGLVVATFIDFEHYIIPDEITIGGMIVGFLLSAGVPQLHGETRAVAAVIASFAGILVGGGMIYAILRLGKLLFGRQKLELAPDTRVVFTETALVLPDQTIPYEDLFYRKSDTIALEARLVELVDRCYSEVRVRLSPQALMIGDERLDPETMPHMEVVTGQMVLPREAMGFGDVKFMAAIGAFLGWHATIFCLMASSMIGALVGGAMIAFGKKEWSTRLPYGPYIALAAILWVFGGQGLVTRWWSGAW